MKLNPDCVRDVLLTVEANTDFQKLWYFSEESICGTPLSNYSFSEVVYHISQCYKSDLIDGCRFYDSGESGFIGDLTPAGHQFLADIRKDTTWNKTKEIAQTVGSDSLDVLKQIASGVIATMVQAALNGLK